MMEAGCNSSPGRQRSPGALDRGPGSACSWRGAKLLTQHNYPLHLFDTLDSWPIMALVGIAESFVSSPFYTFYTFNIILAIRKLFLLAYRMRLLSLCYFFCSWQTR